MSSPASQTHNINPVGTDGIVRCYCNEPAPLRTSTTQLNPNRQFYSCIKNRGEPNRCKFYKWKDELDRLAQPPVSSQLQVSAEPTPSQRQRADIARGFMTPSPKKRSDSLTSQMTPSQRRLADIEASLAEAEAEAAKQKRMADIEAGIASTSQLHSPTQTVDGSDDGDVFHSAVSSSPRSTHYHIHLPPDTPRSPKSPKRPRLEQDVSGNNSMLMTPPGSDRGEFRGAYLGVPPESPSIGKRKEREGEEGELSQFQRIMRDPDHSFHERAASLKSASQSVSHQTSPSQNPVVLSNTTPETIKTLISDLSSTLPPYIAKLERKQIASEKSSEAKARKIEELERENILLRNKIRVLEETVSALKARRPL